MKTRNKYIQNVPKEKMESLVDDYHRCGFDTTVQGATLVVHTARQSSSKKERAKRGEVSKSVRKYGHVKKEATDATE